MDLPMISLDIEPTNRCNAKCYFCPRDQTPDQGLLQPEVFEQALARAIEFRPLARRALGKEITISLCGLGEPLLNKHTVSYVAAVVEAGFDCAMATNGALLSEETATRLLDAGLGSIQINVGERDEQYESIYKLPWERTFQNVVRFRELADGRCDPDIVLVDHRDDPGHTARMEAFWEGHGFDRFVKFGLINRGGALHVDSMQYEQYPEQAEAARILDEGRDAPTVCQAPFSLPFIGYDGNYYLCCSDWRKEAPMGNVFERSMLDVTGDKLGHVTTRDPVCKSCNHDPLNRVTDELRLLNRGEGSVEDLNDVIADVREGDAIVRNYLDALGVDVAPPTRRTRIPLRVTT